VPAAGCIIISNIYTDLAKPDEGNKIKERKRGLPNEKRLPPQVFHAFFFRLPPT
jgi:hypothetical protein